MRRGILELGDQKAAVKYFVITQLTKEGKTILQTQPYNPNGDYVVIYMENYRQFIVMDEKTFNSMYVQMFILGRYDKNLFELVVSSPYSKIYKLKK
jgi:dolichyl-diphosphooligosaccharide--protein glycosyltransferase/undecaprenyl-diphosphooligosaccharide--protein glycosyltransferase